MIVSNHAVKVRCWKVPGFAKSSCKTKWSFGCSYGIPAFLKRLRDHIMEGADRSKQVLMISGADHSWHLLREIDEICCCYTFPKINSFMALAYSLHSMSRKQQNPNRFYSTSHHVIIISSWGALGAAYREKLRRVFHSCGERARLPWPGGAVPVPWPGAWAAVAVLWTWRRWRTEMG